FCGCGVGHQSFLHLSWEVWTSARNSPTSLAGGDSTPMSNSDLSGDTWTKRRFATTAYPDAMIRLQSNTVSAPNQPHLFRCFIDN
ncbi:MAG: hypothetical protein VX230_03920, partial [Candidatus Thermoplasmatota archaeon]|nr:hypothetical protein [Candidatus Thermoplasmatota archaeon]